MTAIHRLSRSSIAKSLFRTARWLPLAAWLVILVGLMPLSTQAQTPLRLGLLGDSGQDEYQGSDYRGGRYHAVTFNWVEQLVKNRGVQVGVWGTYPEPRRTGFAANWSRSGATTASLLVQGQHLGLAAQLASGQIDVVIITIGNNDFAPYRADGYEPIYSGQLSGAALMTRINTLVTNVTTAVETLQRAGQVPILLTTITDWNTSPLVVNDARFADPTKRQRVTAAITAANAGLTALAQTHGLTLVDSSAVYNQLLSRLNKGQLLVGGVPIQLFSSGDEPHNGLLGDQIHGGTVLEGLLANVYVETLNRTGQTRLAPLTEAEILANAGLGAATPTPVPANQPPMAQNDAFSLTSGTSITITFAQLLANDTDPDGDRLSVITGTKLRFGTVTAQADGSGGSYTPNPGFVGQDGFTYTISDGRGGTATATVTLTVR